MQGAEAAGWTFGRNLIVETRYGGGDAELTRKHAQDLVVLSPDVILVQASPQVALLKQLTQSIPIVFVNVTDPVEAGFVKSLARPGGNITGFSNFEDAMAGKWLELLRTIDPGITKVLFLMNERNPSNPRFLKVIQQSALQGNVEAIKATIQNANDIRQAITAFASGSHGGLVVPPDNTLTLNRELIVSLAAQYRLPAIYVFRAYVSAGGLMSYGIDVADIFRKAASYVDRILRGAPVSELPVQAPTKFDFAINIKVARSLGLSPSPSLVALADEVIE
jgi:putative ABC transport system substrate-binding protein